MPWLAVNEQILKQIYKKATKFVEKENLLKHENAPNQGTAIQVLPVSYPLRSKFTRAKAYTMLESWLHNSLITHYNLQKQQGIKRPYM